MGRLHGKCGPRRSTDTWSKERHSTVNDSQNACLDDKYADIKVPGLVTKRVWVKKADNEKIADRTIEDKAGGPAAEKSQEGAVVPWNSADAHLAHVLATMPSVGVAVAADPDRTHLRLEDLMPWDSHDYLGAHRFDEEEELSLQGDETLAGPDGELYEIFYPPDCIPEYEQEGRYNVGSDVSTEDSTDRCCKSPDQSSEHSDVSLASPRTVAGLLSNGSSAEITMEAMVTFMSLSAVNRYPARAKLFETVRMAAAAALGQHFLRFSLVGSTAIRIDTPDSDLDAVVFTQSGWDEAGLSVAGPSPSQALHRIADGLQRTDQSLRLQLVDGTRVPVLTVLTTDGLLSLDLTVDQALGEYHALWFRSQHADETQSLGPLYSVPRPSPDGWAQGLEAATLRSVKWWLRRRRIPVPKEGGYPSIVWTLLVLHVLRCSVFVDDVQDHVNRGRALLGAIAAFFDRFSDGRLAGTLLFAGCAGAEFYPQSSPRRAEGSSQAPQQATLSVLDPTTTNQDSAALGIEPLELAPRTSAATHLLYSYELRRAQQLSAAALAAANHGGVESACDGSAGGVALRELFSDIGRPLNTLSATMPSEHDGLIVLHGDTLMLGILHRIRPKPRWNAPFLHRQDTTSSFALRRIEVDEAGVVVHLADPAAAQWFHPRDFVCMAPFDGGLPPRLNAEGLQRWQEMQALAQEIYGAGPASNMGQPATEPVAGQTQRRGCNNGRRRHRWQRDTK